MPARGPVGVAAMVIEGYSPSETRGVVGEPQARGTDLAAGRLESATQTTQARSAMAERRFQHPPATGAPEPRLEHRYPIL